MRQCSIPFDCGRSYQYPREVWRPTRVENRCAFGPGAALPARTSDPAEDLRPRPRRHTVPANEMLVRLSRHANCFAVYIAVSWCFTRKMVIYIFVEKLLRAIEV